MKPKEEGLLRVLKNKYRIIIELTPYMLTMLKIKSPHF